MTRSWQKFSYQLLMMFMSFFFFLPLPFFPTSGTFRSVLLVRGEGGNYAQFLGVCIIFWQLAETWRLVLKGTRHFCHFVSFVYEKSASFVQFSINSCLFISKFQCTIFLYFKTLMMSPFCGLFMFPYMFDFIVSFTIYI